MRTAVIVGVLVFAVGVLAAPSLAKDRFRAEFRIQLPTIIIGPDHDYPNPYYRHGHHPAPPPEYYWVPGHWERHWEWDHYSRQWVWREYWIPGQYYRR